MRRRVDCMLPRTLLTCDHDCVCDCAPGRYGSSPGLTNATCSGVCSAGYVCPAGSSSSTVQACGGPAWYCPEGSGSAKSVPAGWYSTGQSASTRSGIVECGAGRYCIGDGEARLCESGRYGNMSGLSSDACSGECVAGYYCPAGSSSAQEHVRVVALSCIVNGSSVRTFPQCVCVCRPVDRYRCTVQPVLANRCLSQMVGMARAVPM